MRYIGTASSGVLLIGRDKTAVDRFDKEKEARIYFKIDLSIFSANLESV